MLSVARAILRLIRACQQIEANREHWVRNFGQPNQVNTLGHHVWLWEHTKNEKDYDSIMRMVAWLSCLSDRLVEYEDTEPHARSLPKGKQKL